MPPKLAPFSARLIAMPRFLSNHRPERVGDDAEAGAGPAEGEHRVGEIKLPGLAHLPDRDGRERHRHDAGDQAIARAERLDRLADEGDQQRAEQIEEGGAATRSATPASRAGAAVRRHRRSGHRSRAPSRRSRAGSRPRRCASRHSGARFRRWRCGWMRPMFSCFCSFSAPSCPGLSRASTSFLLMRHQRRGWPGQARP